MRSRILLFIVVLAALFRFLYIDRIPAGISGDELHYILTAKSVWLTGHDSSGTWNPLSAFLFHYPPNESQAELPYFLHLPFSGPFPFSLFLAKLPFALLSIGIVILLYKIAQKLFGNATGIATGLIAAVNPWLVVMGRTGYESTPATFFYLSALWILLTFRSWSVLWSLVPLMLAFYSYIGTKIILVPFVILAFFLTYQKRTSMKPYVILMLSSAVVTAGFLFLLLTSPAGTRISEILLPSSPEVAATVNEIRKTSIQSPLVPFVVNKYTDYLQIISSKFFRIFSPTYLFLEGDQFFLPARQSFFYYIDFLFILWGTISLFSKKPRKFLILSGFIVAGTLPHLFHTTMGDFSAHLAMMFPFMIILAGAGIAQLVSRPVLAGIAALLYVFNIASFSMIYFFQYPLVGTGDFPMRVLSAYVTLANKTKVPVTIYSSRSGDLLTKYLFYSNTLTRETLPELSGLHTNKPFTFNNIRFTDCDSGVTRSDTTEGVIIYDHICSMNLEGSSVKISSLLDGGAKYTIHNDTVCGGYALNPYPSGITISSLAIEQLLPSDFCRLYISR